VSGGRFAEAEEHALGGTSQVWFAQVGMPERLG
jgi:hypothetical protein